MASSVRHYALDDGPTPEVVGSIRDQIAVQAHVVSILSLLGFSPTARIGCSWGSGTPIQCPALNIFSAFAASNHVSVLV